MAFVSSAGNPIKGRPGGGGVFVKFDAKQAIALSNQIRSEAARLGKAANAAHEVLAIELQKDIAKVLADKVADRGRVQGLVRKGRGRGEKPRADRLGVAIQSKANRRVNQQGFTVGYLDEIAAVAPYYRNLEVGTDVHKGRYLSGVFLDGIGETKNGAVRGITIAGGQAGRFTQSPKNGPRPFHYGERRPYFPGVRIKKGIIGYRYFRGGQRVFQSRLRSLALTTYQNALKEQGIVVLGRAMSGGIQGGKASGGQYSTVER